MIVRYVTVVKIFYIFVCTVYYGSGAWPGGGTQYLKYYVHVKNGMEE